MFFNISATPNPGFPNHVEYAGLSIDLDNGWTITSDKIYKGIDGNECAILLKDGTIEIDPITRRTFPIFHNRDSISNIIHYETEYFSRAPLTVGLVKLLPGSANTTYSELHLSDDELFEKLYNYLDNKIGTFKPSVPIKFFPTGGVDTTVIFSFVQKHKLPYEILTAEYKEMDHFTCWNRPNLGKFWCYRNIHHWREHSILLSGSSGDEIMIRNPKHAYMLGMLNDENILDTLKDMPDAYHSHYFRRSKHKQSYEDADESKITSLTIKQFIIDNNCIDFQHWHLGNTLTWTPLNDIEISNIMLNFSYGYIRGQLLDASISKQLIARNNPNLLRFVSSSKNNANHSHLVDVFEGREEFK